MKPYLLFSSLHVFPPIPNTSSFLLSSFLSLLSLFSLLFFPFPSFKTNELSSKLIRTAPDKWLLPEKLDNSVATQNFTNPNINREHWIFSTFQKLIVVFHQFNIIKPFSIVKKWNKSLEPRFWRSLAFDNVTMLSFVKLLYILMFLWHKWGNTCQTDSCTVRDSKLKSI